MKRVVFGCTLMLLGIIGASAFLIAHAILVGPSAWENIMTMIPGIGSRGGVDGFVVLAFGAVSIIGCVIAIKELRVDP